MRSSDPLLGRELGNFLIQQPLGRGGMAHVYKGLDVSLKRPVAIKVIGEVFRQSETYRQRFEREAQAVANLHHPNIVSVFYFGTQDNLYYLVMEYIDGTDLEIVLRNYADHNELMPYADVTRVIEATASALDYAHEQGVIHRDVKPSNIMMERSGRPVLTDFGLALRMGEGTRGDTFGTPHYISPEQAQNSANAVPQSDLYSLGVIAYELLAGAVPFDDPSPTALVMQHVIAAVPSPRAFNPNLSVGVEQVLFKALAKEPNERYATGAEFAHELRQSLETMLRSPQAVSMQPEVSTNEAAAGRTVSMQTVLDKVHQELAMQQAVGQTITRSAEETITARLRLSGILPYIVATSVTVAVLIVIAIIVSSTNAPALPPTSTVVAAVVSSPTSVLPTATTVPPTTAVPLPVVATDVLSQTPIPPTLTPLPPAHTPVLSSATMVPPTVAIPPAETSSSSEALPNPTAAPSNWLPVRFVYNADLFYWLNDSNRSINARPIVFERIGGTGRFDGQRWAYWTMESGRCMEIRFADVTYPQHPDGCRPNAYFTPTRTQDTDFWTGSGAFRVLWNGTAIAVCQIADGVCNAQVPPA